MKYILMMSSTKPGVSGYHTWRRVTGIHTCKPSAPW